MTKTPQEADVGKKSFWKKLDLFHWMIIVVAIIVIFVAVVASMGEGMRPLSTQEIEQLPPDS